MTDSRKSQTGERAGLVVTNLIKLGGLGLVCYDALTGPPGLDPVTLGVAAFMMAGAQGIDTFLTTFFGGPKR